ncbi:hypothetical protein SAMN05428975_1758 [Mucilaginibacter sp. OK268]|nr:hypothetical protein SAMN05428975_1758 [Mucilaginibacter sp. OK268]
MVLIKNVKNYRSYWYLCRQFVHYFEKFNNSSLLLAQNSKGFFLFLVEMTFFFD